MEEGCKGNSNQSLVEDDISNTPSIKEPEISHFTQPRDTLTYQSQEAKAKEIENEMEISQDLPRPDKVEMKRMLLGDGTRVKATQGSKQIASRGLGVTGSKSLKRHISNPDTKFQYNQCCSSLGSLQIVSNGNKFSQITAGAKVRMGNLV